MILVQLLVLLTLLGTNYKILAIKQNFIITMSRCQHNTEITKFCLTQSCTWKQSGGCESCIKKYHKHVGKTNFVATKDIVDEIQKFHFGKSVKPHNKALFDSILTFLTEIKNEWAGFIEKITDKMANQLGHPFLNDTPYLDIYKKLRNKQYKKMSKEKLSDFLAFARGVNIKQVTQKQQRFYHIEAEKSIKMVQDIKQGYQILIQSLRKSNIELNNFEMSFKRILQVNNARKISKAIQPLDFSRISKRSLQKDKPKIESQSSRVQYKNQQLIQQENLFLSKDPKKIQIQRQKQLSIDNQIRNPINRMTYDEKQRQINDKKTKLMSMIHTKSELINDKNGNDSSAQLKISKQQSTEVKSFQTSYVRKQDQAKLSETIHVQKVFFGHRRGQTMSVNTQRQQQRNTPKFSLQKDLKNSIQLNQLNSSQKMDKLTNFPAINSSNNEDGKNIFDQFKSFGIDFAEVVIQNTKLPQAPQKRRKYENSPQVKKKTIKVPMAAVQEQIQPSSPLLKRRKVIDKQQAPKIKLYSIENQSSEFSPQNSTVIPITQTVQQNIKANEAQSLALLMEAVILSTEKAIPILENALRIAENNYSAAQYLSFLYLEKEEAKKCLELCNRYLQRIEYSSEFDQLSGHLLNNKGAALNFLGRFSEAIEVLQSRVRIAPNDTLYKNLGDAYFGIGIYEKSIFHYENAIKLNPKSDQALYNLAVCLYVQINYYNALEMVKRALQLSPNNKDYRSLKQDLQRKINFSKELVYNFEHNSQQNYRFIK